MTIAFQGIGVAASQSVAIGPVHLTGFGMYSAARTPIAPEEVAGELDRLNRAVAEARHALKLVRAQVTRSTWYARSRAAIACDASPPSRASTFFAGALRLRCSRELMAAKTHSPGYALAKSLS